MTLTNKPERGFLVESLSKIFDGSPSYSKPTQVVESVKVPSKGTIIKLTCDPNQLSDVALQARGILACLSSNGGVLEKGQLVDKLGSFVKTKQPLSEIWRFYSKKLLAMNYISIEVKDA